MCTGRQISLSPSERNKLLRTRMSNIQLHSVYTWVVRSASDLFSLTPFSSSSKTPDERAVFSVAKCT